MGLRWMRKDEGSPIAVGEHQVGAFAGQGFTFCDPPEYPESASLDMEPREAPVLVRVYRDDQMCMADERQLKLLESCGWSKTKGDADGSAGTTQHQEHGLTEDESGPIHEAKRVEQPPSQGRVRSSGGQRRKR